MTRPKQVDGSHTSPSRVNKVGLEAIKKVYKANDSSELKKQPNQPHFVAEQTKVLQFIIQRQQLGRQTTTNDNNISKPHNILMLLEANELPVWQTAVEWLS